MSKHTPGPWKAVDHSHYPGVMVVEGPEMPITIITSAIDIDFESYMRRVANAHLIAAAPDLLEALETLKREIILSDVDMGYIASHFQVHIDKASAAIARAKGESQ
jgi:hypothetical protein